MMATTSQDRVTKAGLAGLVLAGLLGTVGCKSNAAHEATAAADTVLRAAHNATAAAGASAREAAWGEQHRVDVPGRTLLLPASDWTRLENKYSWAENFQATRKDPRSAHQVVVTVFKLPMSDDRRSGVRISPNEYLDALVTNTGELTVRIRLDKRSYWVMSQEMFATPSVNWGTHDLVNIARSEFQPEIDTTRYLLQSAF